MGCNASELIWDREKLEDEKTYVVGGIACDTLGSDGLVLCRRNGKGLILFYGRKKSGRLAIRI